MMQKIAKYGTAVILAHAVVVALHSAAHVKLQIDAGLLGTAFIAAVIILAPILAMFHLWTRYVRIGVLILLGSMAGALAFGVYNHFLIPGPDHILHIPPGPWQRLFQTTAIFLIITEGIGCWIGVWATKSFRQTSSA